jgi:5-oxoprolinase (ATP-hydrolysing) subunit A
MRVDLNADVGEGIGDDAALMPFLSSANIACGYHAGDASVMRNVIGFARRHHVAVGAHPGFEDRKGFGRRELQMTAAEVESLVARQIDTLAAAAAEKDVRLTHVKPHGALYNMAARDPALASAIARSIASVDRSLMLFGLAGSKLIEEGQRAGLRTASEVFADRGYRSDGSLVPRSEPGALLDNGDQVVARALSMIRERAVMAIDGTVVPLEVDTICIHGDTPGAVEFARQLRAALDEAGIEVIPP